MPSALNAIPLGILIVVLILEESIATRRGTKRAVFVGVASLLAGVLLSTHYGDWDVVVAWAGPLVFIGWIWIFRTLFTSRDGVTPRLSEDVRSWRDMAYMTALFAGAWTYGFAVFG